jgi:DNA-binding transcriptional LysR family regulator
VNGPVADLRALRTFEAVARHRSFTSAARELEVSQQAVSRSVAALEDELQTRLLERTTRSVALTPAGQTLAADSVRILADVDVALERAREAGRGGAGSEIRIAVTPAVEPPEVSALVAALRADVADVSVAVDRIRPRRIARELASGEADVVLGRALGDSDEIEVRLLGATRAAIAVPAAHRLARRKAVALRDLDGERLVTWNRRSVYTSMLLGVFERAGVEVEQVVSSVIGGDDLAEVAAGEGVALVPADVPRRPEVVVLDLTDDVMLPLQAAWRRWGARPVVARFVAAAERVLAR